MPPTLVAGTRLLARRIWIATALTLGLAAPAVADEGVILPGHPWQVPPSSAPAGNAVARVAAVDTLRMGAERGDPKDQCALGDYYAIRAFAGLADDGMQAVEWWLKSAGQGNVRAMDNLLLAYLFGKLVPPDPEQSVYWARKAADRDEPIAEMQLGRDYTYGIGVAVDKTQAIAWFRKAGAHGGLFHDWAEPAIAALENAGTR